MAKYVAPRPDFTKVCPSNDGYARDLDICISYVADNVENSAKKRDTLKIYGKKIPSLSKMPDSYFEVIGKYAYVITRGGKLSEEHSASLDNLIQQQLSLYERIQNKKQSDDDTEVSQTIKKPSPQEHIMEQAVQLSQDIDNIVDGFISDENIDLTKINLKKMFLEAKFKLPHYKIFDTFYDREIQELNDVLDGSDEQLVEAYSHIKKSSVRKLLAFYVRIKETVAQLGENAVPVRKTKPLDKDKLVKKFKYLKSDGSINSISPTNIIGAKKLWIYNTKTRKLGVYHAIDFSGLSVKGTSIINYSDDSIEKTIRKSHKIDIGRFSKLIPDTKYSKFDAVSSIATKLNGRSNEHCIIIATE